MKFIVIICISLVILIASESSIGPYVEEACYGVFEHDHLFLNCSEDVIHLWRMYAVAKYSDSGCPVADTTHTPASESCCIYANDTVDCKIRYYDTNFTFYDICMGNTSCQIQVSWNNTDQDCDQTIFPPRTNYMRLEYDCIPRDSVTELGSTASISRPGTENLYMWNRDYSNDIPACPSIGICTVMTTSGTIRVDALDLRLAYNDTGHCVQKLHILDGTAETDITCYKNTWFEVKEIYSSSGNSITMRLDNTLSEKRGNFWLRFTSSVDSATLTMNCSSGTPVYDCNDDLGIPTTTTTTTLSTSTSTTPTTTTTMMTPTMMMGNGETTQMSTTPGEDCLHSTPQHDIQVEEGCFGYNGALTLACCSSEVIYIETMMTIAKASALGCPAEDTLHTPAPGHCCFSNNDTTECAFRYYSTNMTQYDKCMGANVCTVQASRNTTTQNCNQTVFPAVTNYMRLEYYCIPVNDIAELGSSSTNIYSGEVVYMWNKNFGDGIPACPFGGTCTIHVTSGTIRIDALFLQLAYNSAGLCAQKLHITDGTVETDVTCYDNTRFQEKVLYKSRTGYILVRLDTILAEAGGHAWLRILAAVEGEKLSVNCYEHPPLFNCTDDLGISTTTTVTTSTTTEVSNSVSNGGTATQTAVPTTDVTTSTITMETTTTATPANSMCASTQETTREGLNIEERCYGVLAENLLQPYCCSGEVLYFTKMYTYVKPSDMECPSIVVPYHFPSKEGCCNYYNDSVDCGMRYYDSNFTYYDLCMGKESCTIQVSWNNTDGTCDQIMYPPRTNYMRIEYQCVPGDSIAEFGTSTRPYIDKVSYIWNKDYSNGIGACPSGGTCTVFVTSGTIRIDAIDLRLAYNSSGYCVQKLQITDGATVMDITCYNNTWFDTKTLYESKTGFISIRLDNTLNENKGNLWLKISAVKEGEELTLACFDDPPVFDCNDDIGIATTTTTTSTTTTSNAPTKIGNTSNVTPGSTAVSHTVDTTVLPPTTQSLLSTTEIMSTTGRTSEPTNEHVNLCSFTNETTRSGSHVEQRCYGVLFENLLQPYCCAGEIMYFSSMYTYAKSLDMGCPSIATTHQSSEDGCCYYINETVDCGMRYHDRDFTFYEFCTGTEACTIQVSWNNTEGTCNQTLFPDRTNYMRVEYECVSDNKIATVGSSVTSEAVGNPVFISNLGYRSSIPECFRGGRCSVVANTGNITVEAIDLRLAVNSSDHCVQWITITDGDNQVNVTCDDNNNFEESSLYSSKSSSISVTFRNQNEYSDGNLWIKFTGTSSGSSLMVTCVDDNSVNTCNLTTTPLSTTTLASTDTTATTPTTTPCVPSLSQHTVSGCNGDSVTITCPSTEMIVFKNIYAYTKLRSQCFLEDTQQTNSSSGCCVYDCADCHVKYTGSNLDDFKMCSGQSTCTVPVNWVFVDNQCDVSLYHGTSLYIAIDFHCISDDDIVELPNNSTPSSSTTGSTMASTFTKEKITASSTPTTGQRTTVTDTEPTTNSQTSKATHGTLPTQGSMFPTTDSRTTITETEPTTTSQTTSTTSEIQPTRKPTSLTTDSRTTIIKTEPTAISHTTTHKMPPTTEKSTIPNTEIRTTSATETPATRQTPTTIERTAPTVRPPTTLDTTTLPKQTTVLYVFNSGYRYGLRIPACASGSWCDIWATSGTIRISALDVDFTFDEDGCCSQRLHITESDGLSERAISCFDNNDLQETHLFTTNTSAVRIRLDNTLDRTDGRVLIKLEVTSAVASLSGICMYDRAIYSCGDQFPNACPTTQSTTPTTTTTISTTAPLPSSWPVCKCFKDSNNDGRNDVDNVLTLDCGQSRVIVILRVTTYSKIANAADCSDDDVECISHDQEDCEINFEGQSYDYYTTKCNGQHTCSLPVVRNDTSVICPGYTTETVYMAVYYMCYQQYWPCIFPRPLPADDNKGPCTNQFAFIHNAEYGNNIQSCYSGGTCTISASKGYISITALDLQLATNSDTGLCDQAVLITDGPEQFYVTCDNNTNYLTRPDVFYTSNTKEIQLRLDNIHTTDAGRVLLLLTVSSGILRVECNHADPVYSCDNCPPLIPPWQPVEQPENVTECRGNSVTLICDPDEVIAIENVEMVAKPRSLGCSPHNQAGTAEVCCVVDYTTDCIFSVTSDGDFATYKESCNSRQSCVLPFVWPSADGLCQQNKYENVTSLMKLTYVCIKRKVIMDPPSSETISTSTSVTPASASRTSNTSNSSSANTLTTTSKSLAPSTTLLPTPPPPNSSLSASATSIASTETPIPTPTSSLTPSTTPRPNPSPSLSASTTTTSSSTLSTQTPPCEPLVARAIYLWNSEYSGEITDCRTGGTARISASFGPIVVYAVDVDLAFYSSVCAQWISVTDGEGESYITCADNNGFRRTLLYTSQSSFIKLRLDNTLNRTDGRVWLYIRGVYPGSYLTADTCSTEIVYTCPPAPPPTAPPTPTTPSTPLIPSAPTSFPTTDITSSKESDSTTKTIYTPSGRTSVSTTTEVQTTAGPPVCTAENCVVTGCYMEDSVTGATIETKMNLRCNEGEMLVLAELHTVAWKRNNGCSYSNAQSDRDRCCPYGGDDGCRVEFQGDEHYHYAEECNGKQSCAITVVQNDVSICGNQYRTETGYMRAVYHCLNDDINTSSLPPGSHSQGKTGDVLYIRNSGYSSNMAACRSVGICEVSSSSSQIIVQALDVHLTRNSSGHCGQRVIITDGGVPHSFTCDNNNNLRPAELHLSTTNSITIEFENVFPNDEGRVVISLKALSGRVSMSCHDKITDLCPTTTITKSTVIGTSTKEPDKPAEPEGLPLGIIIGAIAAALALLALILILGKMIYRRMGKKKIASSADLRQPLTPREFPKRAEGPSKAAGFDSLQLKGKIGLSTEQTVV